MFDCAMKGAGSWCVLPGCLVLCIRVHASVRAVLSRNAPRDHEAEAGATVRDVFSPDRSPLRFDKAARDCEPEPGVPRRVISGRVGPPEALEDELACTLRYPVPTILDSHSHTVFLAGDANDDRAVVRGVAQRIREEIPQDPIDLVGIAPGNRGRCVELQPYAPARRVGFQGVDAFLSEICDLDVTRRERECPGLDPRQL